MNAQLAFDDSSYVPRAVETLDRMQALVSRDRTMQRSGSLGCYEERLVQPDLVRVFDDISHFQIGLLKPPMSSEAPESSSGHAAVEGQASFVPIFPFLYEKLEGGDIIMDRE